jgi:hypothetical protein
MAAANSTPFLVSQVPRSEWPDMDVHHAHFLSESVLEERFHNKGFSTLDLAVSAMISINKSTANSCSGVTLDSFGAYTLRRGTFAFPSPDGTEVCWLLKSAAKPLVEPQVCKDSDFEVFPNYFIPGYPLPLEPKYSRVFPSLDEALKFCRAHPDMCTGVTFNPSLGDHPYSVRSGSTVLSSAAKEKSWMSKEAVKRSLFLYSQSQAGARQGKKSRCDWINTPQCGLDVQPENYEDPGQ